MKIALFPNHPSQLWVLLPVAERLAKQHDVVWFLRDKDVTLALADSMGIRYTTISKASSGLWGNAIELGANIFRCILHTLRSDIDVWVTKYGCGNIAAKICGRKSIAFNDDDADIVPLIAATSYPFSDKVLVSDVTRMGKYEKKAHRYASSHELFYLHPNRFSPDQSIYRLLGIDRSQRYALIRLSALKAHHDIGVKGVSTDIVRSIIGICGDKVRVFITSEDQLADEFEAYRLSIPANRIFDALYHAEFLVGDSQTMTAESATIGTTSFRISDFVGRISYISELEKYGLSHGFKPNDALRALQVIEEAVSNPEYKKDCRDKLQEFLAGKIDPVPWFCDQITSLS